MHPRYTHVSKTRVSFETKQAKTKTKSNNTKPICSAVCTSFRRAARQVATSQWHSVPLGAVRQRTRQCRPEPPGVYRPHRKKLLSAAPRHSGPHYRGGTRSAIQKGSAGAPLSPIAGGMTGWSQREEPEGVQLFNIRRISATSQKTVIGRTTA